MDKLKQIESFVSRRDQGQLDGSGGGWKGVAPAVMGRRIDALEARIGREAAWCAPPGASQLGPMKARAFLEDCQRLVAESGHMRGSQQSAPAASGPVAICASPLRPALVGATWRPWCPPFWPSHADREPVAQSERPGGGHRQRGLRLCDSGRQSAGLFSLVSTRLADNRRLCVGARRAYLQAGRHSPKHPVPSWPGTPV